MTGSEPGDDAATTLDPDEREGLLLSYIATRAELNAAEQANIVDGETWAFARRRNPVDERFLRTLHGRMFGQVWAWAGRYRRSDKNVGVDWTRISEEMRHLLEDCRYWVDHGTYDADELAARFHHRLVSVHCYPNGNGRHARVAADLLLLSLHRPRFSWGRQSLADPGETRRAYVNALRAADRHDIGPLLGFVRS
ncbi:MAG: mobile mystery protein B [Xanthomonadaceae bacterium]|nr:mobile mystery protein B [Xanthomonadaceae bacterium]